MRIDFCGTCGRKNVITNENQFIIGVWNGYQYVCSWCGAVTVVNFQHTVLKYVTLTVQRTLPEQDA